MVSDWLTKPAAQQRYLAGVPIALALGIAVILPPRQMAIYVVAWGVLAAVAAAVWYRDAARAPWFLLIFGLMLTAAIFCFMGTLPIRQKSDINLEFLKYGVYAAAFLAGYIALRTPQRIRRFAGIVLSLIVILFCVFAVRGGPVFGLDQSWPVYPPDQNNSVIVIITLAVGIVAMTPLYSKMFMLLVLSAFVAFIESRAGLAVVIAMILLQLRTSFRLALVVLAASIGIWVYMSIGPLNPQTKMIFAAQDLVQSTARVLRNDPSLVLPHGDLTEARCGVGSAAPCSAENLPANRPLMEVGTESDASRVRIYQRALQLSAQLFPNLIGQGDSAVVERLNTPPITRNVIFQHAHNFLLQSYLAYGLVATLAFVGAAVAMAVLAIRRRAWSLLASLVLVAGFGLIEALTSDIRVLTVICAFLGGHVATLLVPMPRSDVVAPPNRTPTN